MCHAWSECPDQLCNASKSWQMPSIFALPRNLWLPIWDNTYCFAYQFATTECHQTILTEEVVAELDSILVKLLSYLFLITSSDEPNICHCFQSQKTSLHSLLYFLNDLTITLRGFVRVPSTSNRQILFFIQNIYHKLVRFMLLWLALRGKWGINNMVTQYQTWLIWCSVIEHKYNLNDDEPRGQLQATSHHWRVHHFTSLPRHSQAAGWHQQWAGWLLNQQASQESIR